MPTKIRRIFALYQGIPQSEAPRTFAPRSAGSSQRCLRIGPPGERGGRLPKGPSGSQGGSAKAVFGSRGRAGYKKQRKSKQSFETVVVIFHRKANFRRDDVPLVIISIVSPDSGIGGADLLADADDDLIAKLFKACHRVCSDASAEEIAYVVHKKGKLIKTAVVIRKLGGNGI